MALGGTEFKMRSTTQDYYAALEFTAGSDLTAGDMVKQNDVVGVIVNDTDSGDTAVMVFKAAKIVVPCAIATSGSYSVGNKVYFDDANDEVCETASGNTLCGVVLEEPAVGDETVLILLDGMLGIAS